MNTIYLLIDPRTGLVRYVGVTRSSLKFRLAGHLKVARGGEQTHRSCWIRQLLTERLRPIMLTLEVTVDRDRERFWIAHYRQAGLPLTNLTDGGDGGVTVPLGPEARARISAALTGRPRPPEVCKAIGDGHRGKTISIEARAKMSKARQGRKLRADLVQTHCHQGHPLIGENLRIETSGSRRCKLCARAAMARWIAAHPERHRQSLRERGQRYREKKCQLEAQGGLHVQREKGG